MKPEEYFPRHYSEDIRVFAIWDVPPHGPFGVLCGWTLGRLFESGQPEKYADPEGFLCMLWLLNLAHQGIYTYFPIAYRRWLFFSEPFPNLRACVSFHGGLSTPGSLLLFARSPDYIPGAKPLELDDRRVRAFYQFFFDQYVGKFAQDACEGIPFSLAELLTKLRNDPHCPEVSRYA